MFVLPLAVLDRLLVSSVVLAIFCDTLSELLPVPPMLDVRAGLARMANTPAIRYGGAKSRGQSASTSPISGVA